MDSKKLAEIMAKVNEFLESEVEEGISVIKFSDKAMDIDGVKIDNNLILTETEGDFMLERVIDIPATRFDPGDTFYEELAMTSTLEEMLPNIHKAIQENREEKEADDALSWLDYENEMADEEEEDDDL